MNDLTKALSKHLSEGRILRFGDFGSFSLTLSSEGAETAEKFNSSMIKSTKIAFRPGIDFKEMLAVMKFEKLSKQFKKAGVHFLKASMLFLKAPVDLCKSTGALVITL